MVYTLRCRRRWRHSHNFASKPDNAKQVTSTLRTRGIHGTLLLSLTRRSLSQCHTHVTVYSPLFKWCLPTTNGQWRSWLRQAKRTMQAEQGVGHCGAGEHGELELRTWPISLSSRKMTPLSIHILFTWHAHRPPCSTLAQIYQGSRLTTFMSATTRLFKLKTSLIVWAKRCSHSESE